MVVVAMGEDGKVHPVQRHAQRLGILCKLCAGAHIEQDALARRLQIKAQTMHTLQRFI